MKTIKPPVPRETIDDERALMRFEDEVADEIDALMIVPRELEETVLCNIEDPGLRRQLAYMVAQAAQAAADEYWNPLNMGLRRSLEFAAHVNVCKRWNQRALDAMEPSEPMEGGGLEHPGVQFNDPIGY